MKLTKDFFFNFSDSPLLAVVGVKNDASNQLLNDKNAGVATARVKGCQPFSFEHGFLAATKKSFYQIPGLRTVSVAKLRSAPPVVQERCANLVYGWAAEIAATGLHDHRDFALVAMRAISYLLRTGYRIQHLVHFGYRNPTAFGGFVTRHDERESVMGLANNPQPFNLGELMAVTQAVEVGPQSGKFNPRQGSKQKQVRRCCTI